MELMSAMRSHGLNVDETTWSTMISSESTEDEKLQSANSFLKKYYGTCEYLSSLVIMDVDWPNRGDNESDWRWFQETAQAASDYYDTMGVLKTWYHKPSWR